MAYSSSRLPTMETCRVRITKKPKSAASLHRKPTSAEDAGCLASVAYRHVISCSYVTRHLVNNIVEALKQNNRVCKIHFRNIRSLLSKALSEMKKPFPALTVHRRRCFQIRSWVDLPHISDISNSLAFAFPTLPKLLSSTRDLVRLDLREIPHSGYFPSDEMVAALSMLPRLKELHILFQSPQSWADQASQRPTRLIHVVLPVLSLFSFMGDSTYLEDIVAQIDTTPLLDTFLITSFDQPVLNTPRLRHFLSRPEAFTAFHLAAAAFYDTTVTVERFSTTRRCDQSPSMRTNDISQYRWLNDI